MSTNILTNQKGNPYRIITQY